MDPTDLDIQLNEQQKQIIQLRELIREREDSLRAKETELKVIIYQQHVNLSKMNLMLTCTEI